MKTSLTIAMIVAALATPMISYAKTDSNGLTRDEVKAQVVQAEKDGTLHQSKNQYPDYNLTAASAAQQSAPEYGTAPVNFSQSGSRLQDGSSSSLFAHH